MRTMKSRLAHRVSAILIPGLTAAALATGVATAAPATVTTDTSPPTLNPVSSTTTGSGWSASSSVPYLNSFLCQLLGQGRYWSSEYGCNNVPPWLG
ncbi:hypothetical protein ACFXO9_35640 [Nocardia tengchongensis]|uniref:hypothetical protein n=1 Tax=Nocardia tengchongensis TaxID=2055889 RepID=UPI0036AF640D